jgi:hypothetical protein
MQKTLHAPRVRQAGWGALALLLAGHVAQAEWMVTCPSNKTVECGSAWDFDPPQAQSEPCGVESLVYDNSVNDLAQRLDPGLTEVGDEIILNGAGRYLSRFVFEYWGTNASSPSFAGVVKARLRFYRNNGPEFNGYATPGTVLYDSGEFAISATARSTLTFLDFVNGAVVPLTQALPSQLTWSVQFSDLGPGDRAGLDIYSPPALGWGYRDYWDRTGGTWTLKTNAQVAIDFAARISTRTNPTTVVIAPLATTTNGAGCGGAYTATRTWLVHDFCGNTNTCAQIVTVQDTTPPALLCPSPLLVADPSQIPPPNTNAVTVTDICGGALTVAWVGDVMSASNSPAQFAITRTYQARDACSNLTTCASPVFVSSNIPVAISEVTARQNQPASGPLDVKDCLNRVVQGTVIVSVKVTDPIGALLRPPVLGLTNGVFGEEAVLLNEDPTNTFNFGWTVTSNTLNGSWTATVTAQDVRGHPLHSTFSLCLNTTQIVGQVELEGFVGASRSVTFAATGGATTRTWTLTLTFTGTVAGFTLVNVPPQTTALSAKTDWSLRRKLSVHLDGRGQATAHFLGGAMLLGADLDGSNTVDLDDYVVLGSEWYTISPLADIDGSGGVDLDDYVILGKNWYTEGNPP